MVQPQWTYVKPLLIPSSGGYTATEFWHFSMLMPKAKKNLFPVCTISQISLPFCLPEPPQATSEAVPSESLKTSQHVTLLTKGLGINTDNL